MIRVLTKTIAVCALALTLLCLCSVGAYGAGIAAADIPVEVEGGGTVHITPEVNCPIPEVSSLEVPNGMTEHIHIDFSRTGVYSYTLSVEPKDGVYFVPASFTALVTVREDSSGELYAVTILTREDTQLKPDVCKFTRSSEPPTVPAETVRVTPTQPAKNPPTSRPKTGDDSQLDQYLLLCILASAGLFILSLIYTISTNRMIRGDYRR